MGCVVYGIQLGWGAWLWVSVFGVFWVLFWVVVSLCVCGACVRAWLGAFGVSTGENILTNVKECREGKLIWRVS